MLFFFFNDTATTEIYTLSLHDALPISRRGLAQGAQAPRQRAGIRPARTLDVANRGLSARRRGGVGGRRRRVRSEEHTSELQSRQYLVCRLLLEKKNTQPTIHHENIPSR